MWKMLCSDYPLSPYPLLSLLHREALSAAALAFDIRVAKPECLVEALLHEVDFRAVDKPKAFTVDDHFYALIFEDEILRADLIGVIHDVRETRATGLFYAQTQA